MRAVIAEALSRGVTVLVGMNALNLPAFQEFAEGLAVTLPPEPGVLEDWLARMSSTAVDAG